MTTFTNEITYPYPSHLISQHTLADGRHLTIRPVRRDEDAAIIKAFGRNLSDELKHDTYMENFKELPESMVQKRIHIDYKKTMTLIATYNENGSEVVIGMVYIVADDNKIGEFDLIITDEFQHLGVGTLLTEALIRAAKDNGLKTIKIIILASNVGGMMLARHFGFDVKSSEDPTVNIVTKNLS